MDLQKARLTITANVAAQALYMKTIDDAEKKLSEDFIEVPYELSIRLGMIDHYRKKHPDTTWDDEKILEHIEYLFDKYEDDDIFARTRDFNVDLDEVLISLDAITDVENIPDIIHVVNSILISSGSTQKMRYFVEATAELSKVKEDVKAHINEKVRPVVSGNDLETTHYLKRVDGILSIIDRVITLEDMVNLVTEINDILGEVGSEESIEINTDADISLDRIRYEVIEFINNRVKDAIVLGKQDHD